MTERLGKETACDILPDEIIRRGWAEIPSAPDRTGDLRTRALVLAARDVPFLLQEEDGFWHLRVPDGELPRAMAEIRSYEEENRGWPPLPPPAPPLADNTFASLSLLALIALFHNLTFLDVVGGFRREEWLNAGRAEAGRILNGELWRTLTALTLHADGEHLLANVLIGAFFIVPLCRELGLATGWALLIVAGVAGNGLNALVQNPAHLAVGGSTAIFGAIGLLAGMGMRRRAPRRYLPLAAAAALLSFLGTGGERTDIGAHLFGFLAGVPLGVAAPRRPFSPLVQRIVGMSTLLAPILAWMAALRG